MCRSLSVISETLLLSLYDKSDIKPGALGG